MLAPVIVNAKGRSKAYKSDYQQPLSGIRPVEGSQTPETIARNAGNRTRGNGPDQRIPGGESYCSGEIKPDP